MGRYLNSSTPYALYQGETNQPYFVDKSLLLAELFPVLDAGNQHICITRPRRFGKTIMANMIAAFLSKKVDSDSIFSRLKITSNLKYKEYRNKYNVISIDFSKISRSCDSYSDYIGKIETTLIRDLKKEYPQIEVYEDDSAADVLETIFEECNQERFVFVLDEWDFIFHKDFINEENKKQYIQFLSNLLKDRPYVQITYMTGILPIAKYSDGSELNMFDEYSMTNQRELAEFTGFTEEEVKELCVRYDMPYEKMKQWYDGYELKGIQIYNPRSVVMSLLGHDFDSYWTKTETYEALKKYIQLDMYNLKALVTRLIAGESVPVNPDKFQNDMTTLESADDVLTLLVHLGYLTYDFYNQKVTIPNQEVQKEFINCIEDGGWEPVMDAIRSSDELLSATLEGDEEKTASMIEQAHQENTSILKYNDENALACVISLAYYSAKKDYLIYRELAGGKGYADMVFIPRNNVNKPAIVVELKWNKTVSAAIEQIKEKQYVQSLKGYSGEVVLVGVNYVSGKEENGEFKKHECRIERVDV